MRIFDKLTLTATMAVVMAGGAIATPVGPRNFDISRLGYKSGGKAMKAFSSERMSRINKLNSKMDITSGVAVEPSVSFSSSDLIGDIDGPNDELWYYTSSMTYKYIEHEYYTESILLEYRFDIYNADAELVGTVHDKMRYEGNEIKAVSCSLVPVISRNFFNDDDKYEVIIGFGINCVETLPDGTTNWLPNSYRNLVYSLGGDKETLEVENPETGGMEKKEFDKPVYAMEGTIGDVLDASVNGKEEMFISFYDESLPEYSEDDIIDGENGPTVSDSFWDSLIAAHITLRVCGKVDSEGKMPEMLKFDIPILSMPGDQENTPFMISFTKGDNSYFMIQYYKDVFFNRYDSPTDDMSMREHNSLMVDIYKAVDGKLEKYSTTEVPFVKDSKDRLLFSFHSVGDFRYKEDFNFGENGNVSMFVTKNNYFADEHSEYSYYHYAANGTKLNDIFENAESNMPMSNVEGFEPQQMFVTYGNGEYIFHFVDLLSGKEKAAVSCYLELDPDSDPDMMTSNIDRVKEGDSYNYAVEMRTPTVDENDNSILRIAWLDADGKFLNMDEVNMGQYVVYAQSYIDGNALRRDLYLADEPHEYMLLIKRSTETSATREDLLIAQAMNPDAPEGRDILHLTSGEKGALGTINPYTMLEKPMLHVYYIDQKTAKMSMDVYYLPFDLSKIEEIDGGGNGSSISYDGNILHAAGEEISVYTLDGVRVAKGFETVSTDLLSKGIYVVVAKGEARKFAVK